jgi:hypothetical protein
MSMLVSFSTKAFGSIRPFASRTNRCFGSKVFLDGVGLPLDHPEGKRLVHVLAIRIRTGLVHGNAHVGRRPRRSRVGVSHTAHVARLKVLFALVADGQA